MYFNLTNPDVGVEVVSNGFIIQWNKFQPDKKLRDSGTSANKIVRVCNTLGELASLFKEASKDVCELKDKRDTD